MTTGLTREQIGGIRLTREIGSRLQKDFPEIADDYRNGMTSPEIIQKYKIHLRYGITIQIAKESVYCALYGNEGGFGTVPYKGLFSERERKRVSGEHAQIYHSAGGRKTLELRVGVHGRTAEQRKEDHKKIISVKGEVSWEDEIDTLFSLVQNPEYQFQQGPYKGRINTRLIAEKLNRTYYSIKSALYRLRKQKRNEETKS